MIQFNLLPDIKLEYIKSRRSKRTVMVIAAILAGGSLGIFVLLFMSVTFQKQHLSNLTRDIKNDSQKLEGIEDLDRILTVQNQLNKLTELHEGKPVTSRLKDYIAQITPAQVSYSDFEINFSDNTIRVEGSADSLKTINQFVDTLKFTKYTLSSADTGDAETQEPGSEEQLNAFSNVVLTSFGKDDKGARYQIDLSFDPAIFGSTSKVKLIVPNITTTRSAVERPSENLLQPLSNTEGGGQ